MSTSMTVFQQDLPDFLRNASQADELTKALAGSSGVKRLSIRGGVFRMIVGGQEVKKSDSRSLQVVIVNAAPKISRTFYEGTYDPDNVSSPSCWSTDGEKPDPAVFEAQATTCNSCPQNIKGSGQGESRACRFSQRLAVQIIGDPTEDVYQLTLPSQSIFGKNEGNNMPFQQYIKLLVANGKSFNTMVTELYFDTDSATPKLFFRPVGYVTKEQYDAAVRAGQSEEAKRAITMNVAQADGVEGKPKLTKKVEEPVAEEPVAEPTKRASKKSEAPAKKDLSALMDEWK